MNRRTSAFIILALIAGGGAGWFVWKGQLAGRLPDGIVGANGRIEATEVDIAAKLPGRVSDIAVREGDTVEAGAIVARLDATENAAQLKQAQAEAERARQALIAAEAAVESRKSERDFAKKELDRVLALADKGYATHERHDLEQQRLSAASAAVNAANAQVAEAKAAITAADAAVAHMESILADTVIKSPIRGRVQYRLVEPGAVLPAGGRLVTLLDLSDVSMVVFLPAGDAGRLVIGDEARVVIDAAPGFVFPLKVGFVSAQAQFTPKTVETASEREKLMFRVKLQMPGDVLRSLQGRVMSGLRGVAYVRTDPAAQWPERLAVKLPGP